MEFENYPVNEPKNLRELVLAAAGAYAKRTAVTEKKKGEVCSYSYARLGEDVFALQAALEARGLGKGRVLIAGPNCYEFAVAVLACAAGKGCAVPVANTLTAEEFAPLAARTQAEAVIGSAAFLKVAKAAAPALPAFAFSGLAKLIAEGRELQKKKKNPAGRMPGQNSVAAIFFTPGSGHGVQLTQRNLCFTAAAVCRMIEIRQKDVFLSVLPLHHVYEITCGLLVPLMQGATIVFSSGLRNLSHEMQEFRPTVFNCVPYIAETMFKKVEASIRKCGQERYVRNMVRITNAIPSQTASFAAKRRAFSFVHKSFGGRLRLILTFGGPADAAVLRGFRNYGILALQSYSLVECAPVAAIHRDRFYRAGASGLPLPGTVLDIYDMNSEGLGEIRCKGANVMAGYFDDPEATHAVMRGGWFYTGDLGYFDADGFLHVIGRKKNMVISASGKQIYPEEIEALLNDSPAVREALVRVVPDKGKEGVHVEALICPLLSALEVRRAVNEINRALPPVKRIKHFTLSATPLPRTPSGRLVRE